MAKASGVKLGKHAQELAQENGAAADVVANELRLMIASLPKEAVTSV
jgi:hypothetical protein